MKKIKDSCSITHHYHQATIEVHREVVSNQEERRFSRLPHQFKMTTRLLKCTTCLLLCCSALDAFQPMSTSRNHRRRAHRLRSSISASATLSSGLGEFAAAYDHYLIDQWGVLFDAKAPYPGSVEGLEKLRADGKNVVLLSNSSKRRRDAVKNLVGKMGLGEPGPEGLYLDIITSGEVGHQYVLAGKHAVIRPGSKVLLCGSGEGDAAYVEEFGCSLASGPEDCDWVLARGNFVVVSSAGEETVPPGTISDDFAAQSAFFRDPVAGPLATAAKRGCPMLVTNPDMIRPGTNSPMPGRIGALYSELGGEVEYIGKPHDAVYDAAFEVLQQAVGTGKTVRKEAVCMVGDAMPTDVLGGKWSGCGGTVLVAHGIHATALGVKEGACELPEDSRLAAFLADEYPVEEHPTHVVPAFRY